MNPLSHLDPRIAQIRHAFEGRPAAAAVRTAERREAAVSLIVRPSTQLELLLIRRAESQRDPWSGHVALPGGRRDTADADLLDTARREAEEEVGVPLQRVGTFIGALDELSPVNPQLPPIIIAPFVLAVPPETTAHPDPREVQSAIWVPLDALSAAGAAAETAVDTPAGRRTFPCLVYQDFVIWGLTYRILRQFLEVTGR